MLFDVAMSVALYHRLRAAILALLLEVLEGEDGEFAELQRTLVLRLRALGAPRIFFQRFGLGQHTLWLLAPEETIDGDDRVVIRVTRSDFRRRDLPLMEAFAWVRQPYGTQLVSEFRMRVRGEEGTMSWVMLDEDEGNWLLASRRHGPMQLDWEEETDEEGEDRLD